MNSLYFGLALLAVLAILHWYVLNDGKGQDDGTKGILAMRLRGPEPKPTMKPKPGKQSFRRQA
jgi:hypothetical protein